MSVVLAHALHVLGNHLTHGYIQLRLTLDKDQNKYKEARMVKVLYEIAMDDNAHARDRISAAKRILDLAAVNDDAEGRVGNLIQGLERAISDTKKG